MGLALGREADRETTDRGLRRRHGRSHPRGRPAGDAVGAVVGRVEEGGGGGGTERRRWRDAPLQDGEEVAAARRCGRGGSGHRHGHGRAMRLGWWASKRAEHSRRHRAVSGRNATLEILAVGRGGG